MYVCVREWCACIRMSVYTYRRDACVCMYVFVYVCMYEVCIHVYIYVCMYVWCVCVCIFLCTCMYVHLYFVCVSACAVLYTYTHARPCICAHVNKKIHTEEFQDPVYQRGCRHQAWIYRLADDSAQWIPCPRVEPIHKVMESSVYEKCCRPIVEIRIVLVDDAFVANHREEANAAIPHVDAYQLMACVGKGPHTAEIYISLRMCPDMNRAVIMGIWEGGTIQKCDYMKDRIQMRARMRIRRNRSKAFFLFSDMIGGMRASSSSSSSSGINGLFTSGGAAIQVTV